MATEVGQRVNDYEVLASLGVGGMGRVYKVRNIISNREEAMKVLLPDFASDPDLAARFMSEIRTLAGLEHPNIAQLRTAFQFQNEFVMVMEYVEGSTLEKLATESKIPLDQVLDYATQALAALSYAHSRGVTHRDIKPANIMVTPHGVVKLMDFGIAKSTNDMQLTRPGTTIGSVYYISPEQVRGDTVDARSDIYSFGVTLYEVLTGQKPFQADTSYSVLYAQLNTAPTPPLQVNPSLPPALSGIVMHAMQKDPAARFQSADEFREALKALMGKHQAAPAPVQAVPAPVQAVQAPVQAAQQTPQPAFLSATQVSQPPQPAVQQGWQPVPSQQPKAAAPIAAASPAPAPQASKSHRGLWIGLGALTAVLALAVALAVMPRLFRTHANQEAASPANNAQTPAITPNTSAPAQPSAPAPDAASQPSPATPAPSEPVPATASAPSKGSAPASAASASAAAKPRMAAPSITEPATSARAPFVSSAPPTPSGPSPQEIRKAHDRLMNLDSRAEVAKSGVEQIRGQQRAQGLDIRGDILAAMSRMNNDLREADRALGQKDLQTADDYMQKADREASTVEKFLGR
jgi:serine/threonine-protein kinase